MEEKQFENQSTKVYPNGLTGKEIIRRITEIYHSDYDLDNPNFDIYNQLLACEAIAESEEECKKKQDTNVGVNGLLNGSYKRKVNFELTESKLQVISKLKQYDYQTPPVEIAKLLEKFFNECGTAEGHWLYIAQVYSSRVINWNLGYMVKIISSGRRTIKNPDAYFTKTIQYRKKRKEFRSTNDTC